MDLRFVGLAPVSIVERLQNLCGLGSLMKKVYGLCFVVRLLILFRIRELIVGIGKVKNNRGVSKKIERKKVVKMKVTIDLS